MGYFIKQSSTARPLVFLMIDSTDHISGKTGLSPTVTISKNGGSFALSAGAVTEISGGWYKVAGNATDTDTLGPLMLHATATGADPTDAAFEVVAFDPSVAYSTLTQAQVTGGAYALATNGSGQVTVGTNADKTGYTVSTVSDKTGYGLAASGLDSITVAATSGLATTFPQMVVQLWRRFFKKTTLTGTTLKTYADDGTTVLTTQTVNETTTTQTQGEAA